MTAFSSSIAEQIWDMKYRFKEANGVNIDLGVQDSWRRVANSLAKNEKNKKFWEDEFYSILEDFKFLPAGRILAGAGTDRLSLIHI